MLSFSAAAKNFALEGIATQSSNYYDYRANLAIDGNADTNFQHKSCSRTTGYTEAWWMVTLKKLILVHDVVVIVNRVWDYGDRHQKKFDVTVGPYNRQYKSCPMTDESRTYTCPPNAIGSTVKISTGSFKELTLCEVFVYGKVAGKNLAREGIATQSTTFGGYSASFAIDGNADSNFDHRSCSKTNGETRPWWMVTFKNLVLVQDVVIVNRAGEYGARLKDFDIKVGPYNGNYKTCGMARNTMVPGETKSYLCSPNAIGSTVKIQAHIFEFITLCEVSIFGKE
ncbi:hypothetical protein LSAT2_007133 [Lamellibrachia satsuma]|nr:hypothetical protein LSAT2_007133 [Lamellibrachia satsuma]